MINTNCEGLGQSFQDVALAQVVPPSQMTFRQLTFIDETVFWDQEGKLKYLGISESPNSTNHTSVSASYSPRLDQQAVRVSCRSHSMDYTAEHVMPLTRGAEGFLVPQNWLPTPNASHRRLVLSSLPMNAPSTPAPSNCEESLFDPSCADFLAGAPEMMELSSVPDFEVPFRMAICGPDGHFRDLAPSLSSSNVYPCADGMFYGYDAGRPDQDLHHGNGAVLMAEIPDACGPTLQTWKGYGLPKTRPYYSDKIAVLIPWALDPLPDM